MSVMWVSVIPSVRATRNIGTASAIGGTPRERRISTPIVAAPLMCNRDRAYPAIAPATRERIPAPSATMIVLIIFGPSPAFLNAATYLVMVGSKKTVAMKLDGGEEHQDQRQEEQHSDDHPRPDASALTTASSTDGRSLHTRDVSDALARALCGRSHSRSSRLLLPSRNTKVRIVVITNTITAIADDSLNFNSWKACR